MIYCTECKKTWRYDQHTKNWKDQCPTCKTTIRYQCLRCGRLYNSLNALGKHLKLRCNKEPSFVCEHCDYKAHKKHSLMVHVNLKHVPLAKLQSCPLCNKTFRLRSSLYKHTRKHHSQSENEPKNYLYCDHCNFKTERKYDLIIHIQRNHMERIFYPCIKCNKLFKQQKYLLNHQRNLCFKTATVPIQN